MYNYAILMNQDDFCSSLCSLLEPVREITGGHFYVLIDSYNESYLHRIYNRESGFWTDLYHTPEIPTNSENDIPLPVKVDNIYNDQLLSMDMTLDTNSKVALSQEDGLMIMELLLSMKEQQSTTL
ncbi:MAG: hypothetical protein ACRCWY_14080 [Cellulosilyticaceae bacterium]